MQYTHLQAGQAGYRTAKTYSEESWAHANSWADPKLLFLNAIAV